MQGFIFWYHDTCTYYPYYLALAIALIIKSSWIITAWKIFKLPKATKMLVKIIYSYTKLLTVYWQYVNQTTSYCTLLWNNRLDTTMKEILGNSKNNSAKQGQYNAAE